MQRRMTSAELIFVELGVWGYLQMDQFLSLVDRRMV